LVSQVLVIAGVWITEQNKVCLFIISVDFMCLLKLAALKGVQSAVQALVATTDAD
jgi:hypothetical protein